MKFFRNIARCFIPVKNRGTIGTIQKTLVFSVWSMLIFTAISVALEIIKNPDSKWIAFIETFAIGSACSIVIVIITTVVQFITTRNDKARVFISQITWLYSLLYMIIEERKEYEEERTKPFVDNLKNKTKEFSQGFDDLYWFNGEIDDLYNTVAKDTLRICIDIETDPAYSHNLIVSDIRKQIINANTFIETVKLSRYNYLEGTATSIKENLGENNDQL